MTEEFGIYINMWKNDKSTGCEIMHKIMSTELAKMFTMAGMGNKRAFKETRTCKTMLRVLVNCTDNVTGARVRSGIDTFLRNKKNEGKYLNSKPGSKRRKAKDNDSSEDEDMDIECDGDEHGYDEDNQLSASKRRKRKYYLLTSESDEDDDEDDEEDAGVNVSSFRFD